MDDFLKILFTVDFMDFCENNRKNLTNLYDLIKVYLFRKKSSWLFMHSRLDGIHMTAFSAPLSSVSLLLKF